MKKHKWTRIGKCVVDSGHLILVDPCYVLPEDEKNSTGEAYTYEELLQARGKDNYSEYQEIIFSGIAGIGLVFSTGLGDGVYPVYARIVEGRVAEVKIKFL